MKNFKHKVVTVILARNRSRRLPGKMTQVLANTDITVLDFILDRCKKLDTWPNIIVATSNNKCDDS